MTVLNIVGLLPDPQVNVQVDKKGAGYSIHWDLQPFGTHVEIYQSTTAERADAVRVRQVNDSYYDSPDLEPGSYYLWTRRVNRNGRCGAYSSMLTVEV